MKNDFKINEDNKIDINLRENILLEASAGTGKTYSLERVILNLICDGRYNLTIKDILVVTFTNKATREMKERIRQILVSQYRESKDLEVRRRLEDAIGSFDEASIFTIHGFCQNTLQTFPFESLSLFNQEINQDTTLLQSAVWDYLRSLEHSADQNVLDEFYSFRGNRNFSDVVSELCGLYNREEFKGQCSYFPTPEISSEIYNIKNEFESGRGELFELIGLFKNYDAGLMHQASKDMKVATRISSFDAIVKGFSEIDCGNGFYGFMKTLYTKGFADNLIKLSSNFLEYKSKNGTTVSELDTTSKEIILNVDMLFACLEPLFDEKSLTKNPIDRFLAGEFIKKAIKGIDEYFKKRQEKMGALSYNDLIENLHTRVMDSKDKSLLHAIQNRYKVALIDEFQDTDKKQWDIFNTIFGSSSKHNFLLIGDPKQSIYGFRGADLEIYYKAKTTVPESNQYVLGTNFRSEKGIVNGVNLIFDSVFDVKTKGNTVSTEFLPVDDCGKEPRDINDIKQNIEFLFFDKEVEKGKSISSKDCKKGFFKTTVNKILMLLKGKKVTPGDICILVENHRDSVILRDSLLRKSIPVVISKQKNVYCSEEADHILLLLKALNRPSGSGEIKSVLLSPLMGYNLKEIDEMELKGEFEVISTRFLLWSQRLIHSGIISLWEEVESFSAKGHLQTRLLSTINGERAYTNYKHLIENLNQLQRGERLNTLSLYQRLHNLMLNSQEDEENSVRLDRESQAVQIMTIHASKGLEFPVLFFAGGFGKSRGTSKDYAIKYADKNGDWTLDFLARAESKLFSERDEWEEKKRLYYVAFTRASSKLYLPLFKNGELNVLSSLYASLNWDENRTLIEDRADGLLELCEQPIHSQLKITNAKKSKEIKIALASKLHEDVESLVSENPGTFYIDQECYLEEVDGVYELEQSSNNLEFNPLKTGRGFRERVTWVSSYSGLTRDSHGSVSKEDADREDDEEVITPVYKKSDEITCFNVPGGATFGDLIHEFFEQVEFGKYCLTLDEFIIDEHVHNIFLLEAKKHFDMDWGKKYALVSKTMVWNTLNCKLDLDGEMVPLGEFGPESRIHEREFYFRVDEKNSFVSHNIELNVEEGFLKGFIDLIFNHKGKLYIADWKTTTIKGEEEYITYNYDAVDKSMREHNYHLQGLIYTVAIYLHLQKTKADDFDYNKDIGGYFYFFNRGIDPNGSTGISFKKPTEAEVLEFIRELRGDL